MEYVKREHSRLHHSLSVVNMITFDLLQVRSNLGPQIRRRMVPFLCSKKCGPRLPVAPVRHFEISVQCAFENLAWPPFHEPMQTQHCSGRPTSFNHSKFESGGLKLS